MKKNLKIIIANIIVIVLLSLLYEFLIRLMVPELLLNSTTKELLIDSLYNSSAGIRSESEGVSFGVKKSSNSFNAWKYSSGFDARKSIIIYLGDSATMGIGVENDSTFAGILSIRENILNLSLIGYSIEDYNNVLSSLFQNENIKSNLKSVFLFWTLNDLYDKFLLDTNPGIKENNIFYNFISFLRQHSKAFIFTKNLFSDRSKVYYEYDAQFYDSKSESFRNSINTLHYIANLCENNSIEFKVILLPYEYQLRVGYESNNNPQRFLIKQLKIMNINILDVGYYLSSMRIKSSDLYLYKDGIHFSKLGHRLIAEFIINELLHANQPDS